MGWIRLSGRTAAVRLKVTFSRTTEDLSMAGFILSIHIWTNRNVTSVRMPRKKCKENKIKGKIIGTLCVEIDPIYGRAGYFDPWSRFFTYYGGLTNAQNKDESRGGKEIQDHRFRQNCQEQGLCESHPYKKEYQKETEFTEVGACGFNEQERHKQTRPLSLIFTRPSTFHGG
jgi:hypothetical protein